MKIWFQLTGTHHAEHPEYILKEDKQFCIYAYENIGKEVQALSAKAAKGEKVNFLNVPLKKQRVRPHKDGVYPEYSWVYDNKASSEYMMNVARQIDTFDDTTKFIVFACMPMLSVLNMFKRFKLEFISRSHLIYYKKNHWESDIDPLVPPHRAYKNSKDGPLDEHISNKEIEDKIIEEADQVYISEKRNILGDPVTESQETINKMVSKRDEYLTNPKIKSLTINNKVYGIMDSIDL